MREGVRRARERMFLKTRYRQYSMARHFYAPEIEDRGAYCFCPVCHSVIPSFCHSVLLSETLTLLITFEQ